MTTRIVIIGAGGHGLVVADILLAARDSQPLDIVGALDDNPALTGTRILDVPVLGTSELLPHIPHDAVIVAIGDNARREQVATELLRRGEQLYTAWHPHASIAADVECGPGCTISAGVVITPGVVLGAGVILNTRCSVDHATTIEPFAHIASGSTIGADARIGARTLIGLGATVMSGRRIGADTIIGAGAVVVHDIPDGVVAIGVPARIQRSVATAPLARPAPPAAPAAPAPSVPSNAVK
jgi:sugar O-acyltransferase (sialic acid O-acetyltransferase NeuD family)